MTEEQKALFKKESKRIALEIMALAMEFPGMNPISITATDGGYFHISVSDDKKIYTFTKVAGFPETYEEIKKVKE